MSQIPNAKSQAGFSLMELMVAMTLMVIVLGASLSLMGSGIKLSSSTYELTDAQENVRIAQEYLARDLTSAGDGLKGIANIELPVDFVKNYLTLRPVMDPSYPSTYVNLGIVNSDDNVPAATSVKMPAPVGTATPYPVTSVLPGTDRVTMVAWDGSVPISLAASDITVTGTTTNIALSGPNADLFSPGEIIAISSQNYMAFGVITDIQGSRGSARPLILTNGDTYGINQTGVGTPINTACANFTQGTSLTRVQIIHYFVDNTNRLIRRVFGVKKAGFIDSVIAEHIVVSQYRYFLGTRDSSGNVLPPLQVIATSSDQVAVRQVEARVTAETTHQTLPVSANVPNGHPQISMTLLTSVRNLQFNQALSPVGGG